jgi:hypothetical protein
MNNAHLPVARAQCDADTPPGKPLSPHVNSRSDLSSRFLGVWIRKRAKIAKGAHDAWGQPCKLDIIHTHVYNRLYIIMSVYIHVHIYIYI